MPEVHRIIDGGGIGPTRPQELEVLSIVARNRLRTPGRDLTGGVTERDDDAVPSPANRTEIVATKTIGGDAVLSW